MNLKNFLSAMAAILPAVGETVVAMHPDNPNEALKIRVGTQLVTAIAGALNQSVETAAEAAPAPSAPGNVTPS